MTIEMKKCVACGNVVAANVCEFDICDDCRTALVVSDCCKEGKCGACPKENCASRIEIELHGEPKQIKQEVPMSTTKQTAGETATIYVDGSWSGNNGNVVGWAYVIRTSKGDITMSGKLTGNICAMHQVGGELKAAMEAVHDAVDAGYNEVVIMHDYIGVSRWIDGRWKTKNEWTRKYAAYMNAMKKKINIRFIQVAGSDNPADKAARAITGAKDRH